MLINTITPKDTARKPGTNTWIYLPLNGDVKDYSGNNRNASISGSFSYPSIGEIAVAQNSTTSSYINVPSYTGNADTGFTISIWVKFISLGNWSGIFQLSGSTSSVTILRCQRRNNYDTYAFYSNWNSGTQSVDGVGSNITNWNNLIVVFNNTGFKTYINGVLVGESGVAISGSKTASSWHQIGQGTNMGGGTAQYSNYIIENKARTLDEATRYFDQTKSLYGITN